MGRLATAFVTVLLVIFWLVFAPTSLGGRAAYVIVSGISMEPLYHRGDLVVLRQTGGDQDCNQGEPNQQSADFCIFHHGTAR